MKKRVKLVGWLVVSVVVALLGGAASYVARLRRAGYLESFHASDGLVLKNIPYSRANPGFNEFDLYLPARLDSARPNGVMLLIHPGSWVFCTKAKFTAACRRYAKAGYITATMNYSLYRPRRAHGDARPPVNFGLMLNEIDACIATIQHVCAARGIRVAQLAIGGQSAGAYLALLYAYSRRATCPLPIAFVFSAAGGVTLSREVWGYSGDLEAWMLGKAAGSTDGAMRAVTPLAFVDRAAPPTIIVHGARDRIMSPRHAELLDWALTAADVPHTLIWFPHSTHDLEYDDDLRVVYHRTIVAYARRYFGY